MPIDGFTEVLGERYALEEVIGRGGMADVYRATDRVLARPVAVKLLRDVTAGESERARFTAEARTLAQLSHTGLVTVLDAGTASDQPYLVMELVDGPSLAACCSGTALQLSRVAQIGIQVANALAFAHQTGIVHRDVKPGNVLLGTDGRVRLADFGIARLVGDTARHTRTGLTIGSPAYLSPEQVRGVEVTPATDVYSLGLVLLEAMTGRTVYSGTPTEAALARLSTPVPIPEDVPPGWEQLLRSMTAIEPADRPTAEQVAARLRELTAGAASTAVTATPYADTGETRALPLPISAPGPHAGEVTQTFDRTRRPSPLRLENRPRWAVVAVVLALIVLGGLVATLSNGEPGSAADRMPTDVPPRLTEPLRELHDAVHGGNQ